MIRKALTLASRLARARTMHILMVRVMGVGALFALDVSLGRLLGVGGYGAFAFVLAAATVVARMAPLGWLNASTRIVRIHAAEGDLGLLKGGLLAAHGVTVAGLLVAALVLHLLAVWIPAGDTAILARLALPLGAGLAGIELHRFILRGQHRGTLGEALPMLLLPAGVLAIIWALRLTTVEHVVLAHIAVCILLVAMSSAQITQGLPAGTLRARARFNMRPWTAMAFAMLAGSAADELSARAAVLVLGVLATDEAAGLYQAAARLALMTVFVLRAVGAAAAPHMAELHHAGDLPGLRSAYGRACTVSAAGALPFLLAYTIRPDLPLMLFGPGFTDAAPILRILAVGYFASALAGPCATTLMMIGHERTYGALAFLGLGLNAGLLVLLVPELGGAGAAVATASALVLVNAGYAGAFFWHTRADTSPRPMTVDSARS